MAQITQAQYNTAKQTIRNVYVRVDLLNFNYSTIDSFSGNLIGGSITSDANSDIRNTCDIELVVTDSSFDVATQGKIWLDRLIQIYVGVDDMRTGQTAWTNKGIYLINQPSYQYDATTNKMSFQGVDLIGMLTGLRGGTLTDSYSIPQGSNVRDAIIACIKENGFNKYIVSECINADGSIQSVPYDMEYTVGSTWWDVLKGLLEILPNYQMYFDNDGVFHYETIPYRANEYIHMTDDIWTYNVISEGVNYDFEAVKNSVKVLGKTHYVEYFPSTISMTGGRVLPTGYTQLEYIQSSGTQYINTGVAPNATKTRYVASCALVGSSNYQTSLWGAQISGGSWGGISHFTEEGDIEYYVGNTRFSMIREISVGTVYNFDCSNNNGTAEITINGEKSTHTYNGSMTTAYNVYIFANDYNGTAKQFSKIKLYSFKMYKNDALVRDYVPCKNASGAIGLYDFVGGQFYANAGSGTFVAGANVSSDTVISMTISALTTLADGVIIGFVPNDDANTDVQLNVNSFGAKDLVDSSGSHITSLENNVYYVAKYVQNTDKWEFLGHIQAMAEWKDTNPDSPFYIGAPAGEIKAVLFGGDYDNIYSDELALARAKWEIWQKCRMQDSIQLTTIPIYWSEVNWMITYTPARKNNAEQYLITAINTSLDPTGTQTYNLVKYYSYYDENDIV